MGAVDYSLYLVTDRALARGRATAEIVRAAVAGGVTCVQLREKECGTREFIEEARLDRVGCFAYSPVDGAAANALAAAVPIEVREERRRRLMDVQEDISAELLAEKIGREITVLVDEVDEEGIIARSSADAPEIDGLVFVNDFFDAEPGDFLQVRVVDADEHDLYAEI